MRAKPKPVWKSDYLACCLDYRKKQSNGKTDRKTDQHLPEYSKEQGIAVVRELDRRRTTPVIRKAMSRAKLTLKTTDKLLTEKTGRSQRIATTLKKINMNFGTSGITRTYRT